MKVAKWGNSLAVRIPSSLAIELGLKEGDEIQPLRNPDGSFAVSSNDVDERRRQAIEWMRRQSPRRSFDPKTMFDLLEQLRDQGSATDSAQAPTSASAFLP